MMNSMSSRCRIFLFLLIIFPFLVPSCVSGQTEPNAWWTAGANPQRSSWSTADISSVSGITWYRPIEAYIDQKTQIIAANKKIYVTTSRGLIALDAENGNLIWRFNTELPLAHSPTVSNSIVFVAGYDGSLYALNDNDGSLKWTFSQTQAGFSTNPLLVNNIIYIGNRDGTFYAVNGTNGQKLWSFSTDGPILLSAAYDNGIVYFASGDNYAYALDHTNGNLIWKSQKLPGERYSAWWPVIFGNKVIFSGSSGYKYAAAPGISSVKKCDGSVFTDLTNNLQRILFFGAAECGDSVNSQTVGIEYNSGDIAGSGWPNNLKIIDTLAVASGPFTLNTYFKSYPQQRTYIALDKSTGQETDYLPFLFEGTKSGSRMPPIIDPVNNVLFARNIYKQSGGTIPRSTIMGYKEGNRYLQNAGAELACDEPAILSGSGNNILYNLCCDRQAGIVSVRNFWSQGTLLSGAIGSGYPAYDPMWNLIDNDLGRLHSYYAGQDENINGNYGSHGYQNPLVPYVFVNSLGQTIRRIFTHRSNTIIALGTDNQKNYLSTITIQNPTIYGRTQNINALKSQLESEITKILTAPGYLNPAYYNVGQKTGGVSTSGTSGLYNFYFQNAGDTLLTLSLAYNRLTDGSLQNDLKNYLNGYYRNYFSDRYISALGWKGVPRENMNYPPEVSENMAAAADSTTLNNDYRQWNFYAFYQYALIAGNANEIYQKHKGSLVCPSGLTNETLVTAPYRHNQYIAGYIGFLKLQNLALGENISGQDASEKTCAENELNQLKIARINNFNKDHPFYGALDNPSGLTDNFSSYHYRRLNLARNFLFMVPELGDYFSQNIKDKIEQAVNEYSKIGPFWFTAFNENTLTEGAVDELYNIPALFAAKAEILHQPADELTKYLDIPAFARGDLFYIQKLLWAIDASTDSQTTPAPTSSYPPGDFNRDFHVTMSDYTIFAGAFNSANTQIDLTHDGYVNMADFTVFNSYFGV